MTDNEILYNIIGAAMEVYNYFGPGLLESLYEKALTQELRLRNLIVQSQIPIEVKYKGFHISNDLRLDLLVNNTIIVELKAVEYLQPVHFKQVRTYMKLLNLHLGLLINFDVNDFKSGYKVIRQNNSV
ncbi:MAG: GxxExxY protein [Bacteroidales bacterium]|nr:GxxExxY protein [Bacteroidales bacterium]